MIAGKSLLDYTNLFSPNDYKIKTREYIRALKTNTVKENIKKELISEKHKKVSRPLDYLQYFVFVFTVSRCVPVSAFASLVGVPVGTASSAVG